MCKALQKKSARIHCNHQCPPSKKKYKELFFRKGAIEAALWMQFQYQVRLIQLEIYERTVGLVLCTINWRKLVYFQCIIEYV